MAGFPPPARKEAEIANKGQTTILLKDVSATMTGNAVLVAAEDTGRGALLLMNCAANDILIYFAPSPGTATPTITAGAAGVYCLKAASGAGTQGGSYEPDAGYIPGNAIWAKGTNADILVAHVSPPIGT